MAHRRHTAGSRWSVEWAHTSWVTAVLVMASTALHARVGEALKVGNEVFLKGQFIQVRQTQPRSLPWVTRLNPLTPRTPAPFSCQAPRCLPLKMLELPAPSPGVALCHWGRGSLLPVAPKVSHLPCPLRCVVVHHSEPPGGHPCCGQFRYPGPCTCWLRGRQDSREPLGWRAGLCGRLGTWHHHDDPRKPPSRSTHGSIQPFFPPTTLRQPHLTRSPCCIRADYGRDGFAAGSPPFSGDYFMP